MKQEINERGRNEGEKRLSFFALLRPCSPLETNEKLEEGRAATSIKY